MTPRPTPPPCRQCGSVTSHREDDGLGITLTCATCGSCTYYERDGITPSQLKPLPDKNPRHQPAQPTPPARIPGQPTATTSQGSLAQQPGRAEANQRPDSSRPELENNEDWIPPYLRDAPEIKHTTPTSPRQQPDPDAERTISPRTGDPVQQDNQQERDPQQDHQVERTPGTAQQQAQEKPHADPQPPNAETQEPPPDRPNNSPDQDRSGTLAKGPGQDQSATAEKGPGQDKPGPEVKRQPAQDQPDTKTHSPAPKEKQNDMTAPTADQERIHYCPALKARALELHFQNQSQNDIVKELIANHDAPQTLKKATVYNWIKTCTKLAVRELSEAGPAKTQGPWALTTMPLTLVNERFTVMAVTDRPTGYIVAMKAYRGVPSSAAYADLSQAASQASANTPDIVLTKVPPLEAAPFREALGPDIRVLMDTSSNDRQSTWNQAQQIVEQWVTRTKRKVTPEHIQSLLDGVRVHINIIQKDKQGTTPAVRTHVTTHMNTWDSIAELTKTHTLNPGANGNSANTAPDGQQTSQETPPRKDPTQTRTGQTRGTQEGPETQRIRKTQDKPAPTKGSIAELIQAMRQRCQELEEQRDSILEKVAALEVSLTIYDEWNDGK